MTHVARPLGPRQSRIYLVLREAIEIGRLRPGQALGSQAQLAQQHGVALATMHLTLRALEQDGYIVRRHGVGTFVAQTPPARHEPLRALARFTAQRFASAQDAADAALVLLAEQIGVRTAFMTRLDAYQLQVVAAYDRGGCGVDAGVAYPLDDAF
ncbi:MAG: GntR family transcriptional regulator [Chloroflexota bacterium]|nr:GntR family transcriptional regulator [Chloroflexota bacterium]PLS78590.1 MAG: hypothetical protein CYG59_17540 [Chloroflexota bacterium]